MYNDAYASMSLSKHPSIFGKAGSEAWGELWDSLGVEAERAMRGEVVAKSDDLLFFNNLGVERRRQETYHTWSWVPVRKEDGEVGGLLNMNFGISFFLGLVVLF